MAIAETGQLPDFPVRVLYADGRDEEGMASEFLDRPGSVDVVRCGGVHPAMGELAADLAITWLPAFCGCSFDVIGGAAARIAACIPLPGVTRVALYQWPVADFGPFRYAIAPLAEGAEPPVPPPAAPGAFVGGQFEDALRAELERAGHAAVNLPEVYRRAYGQDTDG